MVKAQVRVVISTKTEEDIKVKFGIVSLMDLVSLLDKILNI